MKTLPVVIAMLLGMAAPVLAGGHGGSHHAAAVKPAAPSKGSVTSHTAKPMIAKPGPAASRSKVAAKKSH